MAAAEPCTANVLGCDPWNSGLSTSPSVVEIPPFDLDIFGELSRAAVGLCLFGLLLGIKVSLFPLHETFRFWKVETFWKVWRSLRKNSANSPQND
jgi:hypothetical protein